MIAVTVRQDFTIHGDWSATVDMGHSTLAVMEKGNIDIGVNVPTYNLELHKYVTIFLVFDALIANRTFSGPAAQSVNP